MRDFPLVNSNFLAVALYIATTVMVDWIKRYKVCVLIRNNLLVKQLYQAAFCQVDLCGQL